MRLLIRIFLFLCLVCLLANCEKDDICVAGNTPLLVVGFYDFEDTTSLKDVSSLRVRALGFDTSPATFTDRSDQDSIGIPLQVNMASTSFIFISNSATDEDSGTETGVIDTLTFNYNVEEDFVSRGCGFVGNYTDLDTTRNVYSTDWIKRITIAESNVNSSTQVHVKIFH
ncbi:DUF6452 family protein [Croceivirga lutea]|uniref:DUF6452 family protein n=1 Tax=Croceivirga lutea TaxID=1775167 RepID=UPI00163B053F|nr:DUF6452 family protein [Croceivirga lutea]